jgi:hypothetical protein
MTESAHRCDDTASPGARLQRNERVTIERQHLWVWPVIPEQHQDGAPGTTFSKPCIDGRCGLLGSAWVTHAVWSPFAWGHVEEAG